MANKYNQGVSVSSARFTKAPMGELEFSKMYAEPTHTTTFNGGDIVPIYCAEVLPHDTFKIEVDEVIRQATLKVPSMDKTIIDIMAYFVPNRIVNKSWKQVMGENATGVWNAPKVSLAPLMRSDSSPVQIPVGSVADYYGYPTQGFLSSEILSQCHDLKFRGYLEIYNNYFRDQNYQPPIPYSKLNVYNGFLDVNTSVGVPYGLTGQSINVSPGSSLSELRKNGDVGAGAIVKELLGSTGSAFNNPMYITPRITNWRATFAPFKANKLHDYFTSVLPSPQKGEQVQISVQGVLPIDTEAGDVPTFNNFAVPLQLKTTREIDYTNGPLALGIFDQASPSKEGIGSAVYSSNASFTNDDINPIIGTNLVARANLGQLGLTIEDLRMSAAIQQVYEILGRGGSRYTEYINSFFELDIDNPFSDIPTCLGQIRRNLDLYQTAQTSASTEESAQGSLAAFGYTSTGGTLFTRTFLEHGYIHIMAVVRHRNIYPALLSRDNFRLSMLDFYQYPLANISEQPVYTREINPFLSNDASSQVFGYQEAWAEYRTEPDRVSGYLRPGISLSLDAWTLADDFNGSLRFADGNFMQSNTQAVVARGTALVDKDAPQFKAKFTFKITKERPMPTYSMAGLDLL